MTSIHEAAPRRNDYPHTDADQTPKLDDWSRPAFPAAELIERMTKRPAATCRIIASLAGFREMEAQ
jgi:hypothetical protein